MLSSVLSREDCAKCGFCCAFRRQSLWETPLFPPDTVEKLEARGYGFLWEKNKERYGRMDLSDRYLTNDPGEEASCYFLDRERGCTLAEEDKPFDCKIWPLRIMEKEDGALVIALTPTCPKMGKTPSEELKRLVEEGLGEKIYRYARRHPFVIKDYKEGFPILMSRPAPDRESK